MRRHIAVLACAVLALAIAHAAGAQTCRPLDQDGRQFQYTIGLYASAALGTPKAVVRDSIRLAAVPANQVVLVTQTTTCKKANTAYQNRLASKGAGLTNQVYVLQVGTTYAVVDPGFYIGPYTDPHDWTIVIMDSHFKPLALF